MSKIVWNGQEWNVLEFEAIVLEVEAVIETLFKELGVWNVQR